MPDEGDYVLFIGSGRPRPGDLDHQARDKSWTVVNVDLKRGYAYNLSDPVVVEALIRHASNPRCRCIVVSIPCGTWSALRYVKPGPDVLRKLPGRLHGKANIV